MFSFIRNCQIIFQIILNYFPKMTSILYFHQQSITNPVSLYPHWYLVLSVFFILGILICSISLEFSFRFPWWPTMLIMCLRTYLPSSLLKWLFIVCSCLLSISFFFIVEFWEIFMCFRQYLLLDKLFANIFLQSVSCFLSFSVCVCICVHMPCFFIL